MIKQILQYYQTAGQQNETEKIITACKQLYIAKIQATKKPPSPNIMLRAMTKLCKYLNVNGQTKLKVKTKLKNYIFSLRIQGSNKTKMAPIFHPQKLLELIMTLWQSHSNNDLRLRLAKKQTALQAMMCLMTGRRWSDITRIKWDTQESIVTKNGHFIKFLIPVSKSNQIGNRVETITLKQNKQNPTICPIHMLEKYHYWVGQPTNGFVFSCLAPKRTWVEDPINPNWSTYRCKGHWSNETKHECLGNTSSTLSFGYLHRWAKTQKWKILPTKHTFRRTCLVTVKTLGISRKLINEGFGWVPHSDMIRHYTAEQDSVSLNHPAVAIATQLEKKRAFKCLENISFLQP